MPAKLLRREVENFLQVDSTYSRVENMGENSSSELRNVGQQRKSLIEELRSNNKLFWNLMLHFHQSRYHFEFMMPHKDGINDRSHVSYF